MFTGDNRNRQRSGQSSAQSWHYANANAKAQQHTTAEAVNAMHGLGGISRRVMTPVGGGLLWQSPNKELDPTVPVMPGTFVFISPANPISTTGLVDLVYGSLMTARPGIWQAVQLVPAKNSSNEYNVPQIAPLGYPTVPYGTPLSGNADGPDIFWIPFAPVFYC